jgi:hypothetical protein
MGLLRKIENIVDVLTEDGSEGKGDDFERCVVDLFDEKYFSIVQWSTDITRKHDRYVESDSGPDLILRYIPKSELFCVECKFRSDLHEGELRWSNPKQLERYKKFVEKNKFPFFVVIGLGGEPSLPERMYCIPLGEAKYPALFPILFEKYERDPEKPFFWKDGDLR